MAGMLGEQPSAQAGMRSRASDARWPTPYSSADVAADSSARRDSSGSDSRSSLPRRYSQRAASSGRPRSSQAAFASFNAALAVAPSSATAPQASRLAALPTG